MRDVGLDPGSPQWAPDPYAEVDRTRVSRRRAHARRADELDKRLASPTAPDPLLSIGDKLPEHYADVLWREHTSRVRADAPRLREWSRLREAEGSTPEGLRRGAAPARWDAQRWAKSRVPGPRFVEVLREDDENDAPVLEDTEDAPGVDIVNFRHWIALGSFDNFKTPIPSAREEGEEHVPPPWEVKLTPREGEGAQTEVDERGPERVSSNADEGPPDWYDKVVVDRARLCGGARFESKGETREEAVARRLRGHPTKEEAAQDRRRDKHKAMKELKEVRHALGRSNRVVGEKDDDTRSKECGRK
jgi:hypothetical protein